MHNELIFLLHVLVQCGALYAALCMGKGALEVLLCLQLIVANLFVTKEIALFGLTTSCSEVFIVGGMYGFALLREFEGVAYARRVIWYSFYCLLFFLSMSCFHLLYASNAHGVMNDAFLGILSYTPRLVVASLAAYFISERLHLFFHRFFTRRLSLALARPLAVVCGQGVDTVVFAVIGLYGVLSHLGEVMVFSMVVKIVVIAASAPFIHVIAQSLSSSQRSS